MVFKGDFDEATFEAAKHLPQESSLVVTGEVRADVRAPGVPGGFELGVKEITIVQASAEYPITPKEHGIEFLMDHRHPWIRSASQWALLRVRATVMRAIRSWLDERGLPRDEHADPDALGGRGHDQPV